MTIQKRLVISRTPELVYACVDSWMGSMRQRSNRGFLMAAIIFLLASCSSTPPIAFQNTSHRQTYSLNLGDLEKLQFYISRDVVAQYQDATGTKSLLLPRLTPGVATGAGPNWIKVSFRERCRRSLYRGSEPIRRPVLDCYRGRRKQGLQEDLRSIG
jgi:hypothetical protein